MLFRDSLQLQRILETGFVLFDIILAVAAIRSALAEVTIEAFLWFTIRSFYFLSTQKAHSPHNKTLTAAPNNPQSKKTFISNQEPSSTIQKWTTQPN